MEEKNKIIITISLFFMVLSATIYSSIIQRRVNEDLSKADKKLYNGPKLVTTEQIGREVFDSYLATYKDFSKPEVDRLSEYKINKIEVKKEKQDKTEFVCIVKYDVRPFTNSKINKWSLENGKYQDDWIKNKTCFLIVDKVEGEYKIIKNVTDLDLSSINIPNKIRYKVLRLT